MNNNIYSTEKNKSEVLEMLNKFMHDNDLSKLSNNQERLSMLYNMLMLAERQIHLKNSEDKANGFYSRSLGTPLGNLELEVPRVRTGDFRPQILPNHFYRDTEERQNLLEALFAASYSPSQTKHVLSALGMHYSEEEMEEIRESFLDQFHSWMSRELQKDYIAVFIDAYHTDLKTDNKVKKSVVYTVIGLDWDGRKDILSITSALGGESKGFWLQVFNDIINRGLKRLIFVVSDDFPGLRDAVAALFPNALHQLCFVHLQRNITRNLARDDASLFNQELKIIKLEDNFDTALEKVNALLDSFSKKYPSYIAELKNKITHYFLFIKIDKDIRAYFYTTNAVESFNSSLEKLRSRMGGFFQSEKTLKINVFIIYKKLKFKWSKGIAKLMPKIYNLRQLFAQIYGDIPNA